jgi:hypothetical protein
MFKKIISVILIFSVLLLLSSCYTMQEVTIKELELNRVSKIQLKDSTVVDFTEDSLGCALLQEDEIVRYLEKDKTESYPISEVNKFYYEEFDYSKTIVGSILLIPTSIIVLSWVFSKIFGEFDLGG